MNKFYPITEFPTRKGANERSVFVILFNKEGIHFFEFGYYDYQFQRWVHPYFERYDFVCWCYIPDPMEYIKSIKK